MTLKKVISQGKKHQWDKNGSEMDFFSKNPFQIHVKNIRANVRDPPISDF